MRRNRYFSRLWLAASCGMTWGILAVPAAGPVSHETPPHQHGSVIDELDDAGFSNISVDTQSLEYQYLILAR